VYNKNCNKACRHETEIEKEVSILVPSLELKRLWREADHSSPSSAEVINASQLLLLA
jgi:hypothetical protein